MYVLTSVSRRQYVKSRKVQIQRAQSDLKNGVANFLKISDRRFQIFQRLKFGYKTAGYRVNHQIKDYLCLHQQFLKHLSLCTFSYQKTSTAHIPNSGTKFFQFFNVNQKSDQLMF